MEICPDHHFPLCVIIEKLSNSFSRFFNRIYFIDMGTEFTRFGQLSGILQIVYFSRKCQRIPGKMP